MVRITQLFPQFVNDEHNHNLMKEVTSKEIEKVLHGMKKEKIYGPDKLSSKFYIGLYNVLGKDLLWVVEESNKSGKILATFNSTFIVLVPKFRNPNHFKDFIPISLCNTIYKIMTKIISRRIKPFLYANIYVEQFGFLLGRHIHDTIGVA